MGQELVLLSLLTVFLSICVAMSIVAWLIFRAVRTRLSKFIFLFWVGHFLNMFMALIGAGSQQPFMWAAVMFPWPLVYYFMWEVLIEFEPKIGRRYSLIPIFSVGFGLTILVSFFSRNFTLVTLPVVLVIGLTGLEMGWRYWQCIKDKENSMLEKVLLFLIVSFAVHSLDYPFLRPIPSMAIFGFSYFLFNIVGFAAILPTMFMKKAGEDKRQELEILVKEQTEQLLQQSKLSALGEMAAGVAHEINNPLAIIVGRSEQVGKRLDRGEMDKKYLQDSFQLIENTAFRINRIVKALMDFSKQGPQSPFVNETLEKIMGEIKVLCEERFRYRGVKLLTEGNMNFTVKTRGPQISQVILNLLNNAFDAIEKDVDPWVKVMAYQHKDKTIIKVQDSGKGIPAHIRDKIMQPFFTSKDVGKGIGLGLSISRGIVESHGGKFYLDERELHTTFVIELPIEDQLF